MKFSQRINNVSVSGTQKFTGIIDELKKQGKDVISFAVGEPDVPTPETVIRATKKALDEKKTRYSQLSGLSELKEKIAQKHPGYSVRNTMIGNGSKQVLYNLFQCTCEKGDEVIIPRPYWVSYDAGVKLAGARPVFADTDEHHLDIEKIKEKISRKTNSIILNTPVNPTGAVYKKESLRAVCDLAQDHDFNIIYDEAYDNLVYEEEHVDITKFSSEIKDRTIRVKTFSKTYSMTGFRIGYVLGSEKLVENMNKMQSHTTGNVCTFAQYGAMAALDITEKELEKTRLQYKEKRDLAYEKCTEIFDCIKPEGAFYLFPRVSTEVKSSEKLSTEILKKAAVATIPGEIFGSPDNIRISYACSKEDIKEGFERISDIL